MQNWPTRYNEKLQADAQQSYRQAQMEGHALLGDLGPVAQMTSLGAFYVELKASGDPIASDILAAVRRGDTAAAVRLAVRALNS